MEKLLSDKWDNAFLNQMVHEGLLSTRNSKSTDNEQQQKESDYMRATFLTLVDHPQLSKFQCDVLVVTDNRNNTQRDLIFVLKEGLIKSLENQPLPETSDVSNKVTSYIKEVASNAMNNKYMKINVEDFTALLKHSNLQNIVDILDLEKAPHKKHTI